MRFTTLTTLLLPTAILAAPSSLSARAGDEQCAPTTYTLSDYTLVTSGSYAYVNFNFKSTFSDSTIIKDVVIGGANCQADGQTIPNSNECRVEGRKLLFDLRGPQEQAYYQITHTWTCNDATWMSGNAIKVEPLNCNESDGTRTCSGGPQTFAPQNVRKICSTPTC
ncbi:Nn.00g021870.m01.CDS01 [Neocucurbitaria sp. VM-36]